MGCIVKSKITDYREGGALFISLVATLGIATKNTLSLPYHTTANYIFVLCTLSYHLLSYLYSSQNQFGRTNDWHSRYDAVTSGLFINVHSCSVSQFIYLVIYGL